MTAIIAWIRAMSTLDLATWILTVFTGVLAVSTIVYTRATYKLYRSSNKQSEVFEKQTEALNKLTEAVRDIPNIGHELRLRQRLQNRQNKKPRVSRNQVVSTTGRTDV